MNGHVDYNRRLSSPKKIDERNQVADGTAGVHGLVLPKVLNATDFRSKKLHPVTDSSRL